MITAESLPPRPLEKAEADEMETREAVESVIPFIVDGCTCRTTEVNHVFVKIDGEYVGFDFDPEDGWRELSRSPSWDEARTAYVEKQTAANE